jgi:hypothetical protein
MATSQQEPIGNVVDLIPSEFEDRGVRQRLRKLADALDQLAVEEDGDVVVDRDAVEKALRDRDLFPAELQDRVRHELETRLGPKLKGRGKGRHLGWRELGKHDKAIDPPPVDELRKLGIDSSSSSEEVRKALRDHYPDLPESWLDMDAAELRGAMVDALHHNQSVWDCCVRHLGWWATLAVFAAAGAFLIVGTATGPWGIPLLIWLIGVLGGGTAVIVFNCVLNPSW